MDGGSAWVGWQEYNLDALAADKKSDGRAFYNGHAVVLTTSDMASANSDDDANTDPFSLMAGKTSCHTGWLKSAGMLTRDSREVERQKPGQPGARKKFQFSKR